MTYFQLISTIKTCFSPTCSLQLWPLSSEAVCSSPVRLLSIAAGWVLNLRPQIPRSPPPGWQMAPCWPKHSPTSPFITNILVSLVVNGFAAVAIDVNWCEYSDVQCYLKSESLLYAWCWEFESSWSCWSSSSSVGLPLCWGSYLSREKGMETLLSLSVALQSYSKVMYTNLIFQIKIILL